MSLTYVNHPSKGLMESYLNGVLVGTNSNVTGSYTTTSMGNVGINKAQIAAGNYSTNYANMNAYSAMIHNKALTKKEILYNYLVDKQRFNIN